MSTTINGVDLIAPNGFLLASFFEASIDAAGNVMLLKGISDGALHEGQQLKIRGRDDLYVVETTTLACTAGRHYFMNELLLAKVRAPGSADNKLFQIRHSYQRTDVYEVEAPDKDEALALWVEDQGDTVDRIDEGPETTEVIEL